MKFVKGDVIASLVILVVNILGGLAIGVGMKGMPVVDALKRYGLLTIGDGLVTQIPALVLSTAAGVLVTRVASEEADTPLGEELARQLLGVPQGAPGGGRLRAAARRGAGAARRAVPRHRRARCCSWAARARARKSVEEQRAATEPAPKERARAGAARAGVRAARRPVEPRGERGPRAARSTPSRTGCGAMAIGAARAASSRSSASRCPRRACASRAELGTRASSSLSLHEVPAKILAVPAGRRRTTALVAWVRERDAGAAARARRRLPRARRGAAAARRARAVRARHGAQRGARSP